jgi:isoquinoline 1-oxidoreductase subunit beta
MSTVNLDRRNFLKLATATVGSSLVIGMNWGCSSRDRDNTDGASEAFIPNAWLRINADNQVTVIVAESEMGQGPYTLMPMMVAEELEVTWESIKVERASVDPVYGYQITGGSSSIRKGWRTLRQAGAIAREILIDAAAKKLSIPSSEMFAENGNVLHEGTASRVPYGELVAATADISIPDRVSLKEPNEFKIIGKAVHRKDVVEKIDGSAIYGIDIKLPEQLYATVVHCPVFGGRVRSFDKKDVLERKGAIDVFEINEGVALVAEDTWTAFEMARALDVEWDFGENKNVSYQSIIDLVKKSAQEAPSKEISKIVDSEIFERPEIIVESDYLQPFQAHMTMEPMNCTAHFQDDGDLVIWAPTQSPSAAYDAARDLTQTMVERGIKKIGHKFIGGYDDSIKVNTTLLGGGFGRRAKQDYVSEVVQLAEHFAKPVQLVWSREEDLQHDFYHPMTFHEMKGVLDKDGMPIGWQHIIKGFGVNASGASHLYNIPSQRIRVFDKEKIIPHGPWRSVAAHYNVFAVEHFLDELAQKGGHDPLEYRLKLLDGSPRLRKVLELAAEKMNWKGKVVGSLSYGVAAAYCFGSYVAQMLELEQDSSGTYRVSKVVCVIDCGIVINPDIVNQQMEGSVIYGLSAAINSKITIRDGRVEQSNFHDYPILRMDEIPEIEVVIVDSFESPEGIGEPGVPPLAPALANALMAQTGVPVRELPIKL